LATDLRRARRLYEERNLDWSNLYRSLEISRTILSRAAALEPRPRLFYQALELALDAEEEILRRVGGHRRFAESALAAGDREAAGRHLAIILEIIPDPLDPRYRWAKESQLRIQAEEGE
jgi:hypothetical protein